MSRSLPWLAALLLVGATGFRMNLDRSWVGDWNQTGSFLGVVGILGGTGAGMVLALHARRNLRPIQSLQLRTSPIRVARLVLTRTLGPSIGAWLLLCLAYYLVTWISNPSPSAPSAWPLISSTLGVVLTLVVGVVAGYFMHLSFALPAVIAIGFLLPATLGALEPSRAANFTISTNTSLEVQFVPLVSFYLKQGLFFAVLMCGLIALVSFALSHEWRPYRTMLIGGALVATFALVALGSPERIDNAPVTNSQHCDSRENIEVCVLTDHARFAPAALNVAVKIGDSLPPSDAPLKYVEKGLRIPDGAATLDVAGMRIDPVAEVINAAAQWNLCAPPDSPHRAIWLAHRSGLVLELPEFEELVALENAPDATQLQWWREPMTSSC